MLVAPLFLLSKCANHMETPETRALLNNFAIRSFRDVADNDYIVARMAHRATLAPQFLWSSLQAIEKYLKAILLLNRIPSVRPTHRVSGLVSKVTGVEKLRFRPSNETRKFIDYLDLYGRFRYLEVSYHASGLHLLVLDRAVWEIRRYCDVLDYYSTKGDGKRIHMLDRELLRIEESEKHPENFQWFQGEIEKIIADPKHPARPDLIRKNFYFAGKVRTKVQIIDWFRSVNSPLALKPDLFAEVRKYVFLPKDMVLEFEALLKKQHSQ
jgi:hypothetical protein